MDARRGRCARADMRGRASESYAAKFKRTGATVLSSTLRDAQMVISDIPPTTPAVPTAGVNHPAQVIRA
jgi:hypothetical protein